MIINDTKFTNQYVVDFFNYNDLDDTLAYKLNEVIDEVDRLDNMHQLFPSDMHRYKRQPISIDNIKQYEEKYNITLPKDFIWLLTHIGEGYFPGSFNFGISHKNVKVYSVEINGVSTDVITVAHLGNSINIVIRLDSGEATIVDVEDTLDKGEFKSIIDLYKTQLIRELRIAQRLNIKAIYL